MQLFFRQPKKENRTSKAEDLIFFSHPPNYYQIFSLEAKYFGISVGIIIKGFIQTIGKIYCFNMVFNSALEINWLFPNGAKITSFILSRKSESKQWGSIINV